MPGVTAVVIVLAGVVSLWAVARLLAFRAANSNNTALPSARAGARLLAAATIGAALAIAAPAVPQPMYAAAAGVAALCTAAAIAVRGEIGRAYGAPAYAIPSLRTVTPGTPGSISAAGALAAAAAASIIAAVAFSVRLLGPSDPALVALAAYVAMLLEVWVDGAWKPAGSARLFSAAGAALLGAALAFGLVFWLP